MNAEITEKIQSIIVDLLSAMGYRVSVEPEETITKGLVFNIVVTEDPFLLIGRQGEALHCLEQVVQSIVNRKFPGQFFRFSLDIDDFNRKREWYLKETVQQAIVHLRRTGRPVGLMPMPNYERRFIHALIQDNYSDVVSGSQGQGSARRVVLRLKN